MLRCQLPSMNSKFELRLIIRRKDIQSRPRLEITRCIFCLFVATLLFTTQLEIDVLASSAHTTMHTAASVSYLRHISD